jgi:parallel beta-helix repeat protein
MRTQTVSFGRISGAVVVLALLAPAAEVAGSTWSVDCDAGRTINSVLPMLQPGDTVLVRGTCVENLELAGQTGRFDGITLDGQGAATIAGSNASRDNLRLTGVRGVTVRGFRITGGRDAIHVRWSTMVFLFNNTIEETGRNGVLITRGSWVHISNNVIQSNPRNGIEIQESTVRIGGSLDEPAQPAPNLIQDNGGDGILVTRASVVRIHGNTIRSNRGNGIAIEKLSQVDTGANTIEDNSQNGILAVQHSGVHLGRDTGSGLENSPNTTARPNGRYGIDASMGAYVEGRLGSLIGARGKKSFTAGATDSLSP